MAPLHRSLTTPSVALPAFGGWRRQHSLALLGGGATLALAAQPLVRWLETTYPGDARIGTAVLASEVGAIVALVVTMATMGLWLAPGWLVAARVAPDDDVASRSMRAVVLAFGVEIAVHLLALVAGGEGMGHVAIEEGLPIVLSLALIATTRRSRDPLVRRERARRWRASRHHVPAAIVAVAVFTVLLFPRLVWDDLNPDGGELLTMGRTLASHLVARLPTGEIPGVNLGMVTVAYPVHWLVEMVGVSEGAARLPALAWVAGIALGTIAVAEYGSARRLRRIELLVVALGVAAAALTLGWNASYDPYSSDVASPASIDLLAMAFLLAMVRFCLAGESWWCGASAILLALTRPSALMLSGLLLVSLVVADRTLRTPRVKAAAVALVAALLVTVAYALLSLTPLAAEIAEGGGNLLARIRYLRFDDWRRLAWLVVPGSVVPVLSLLAWRRLDAGARALALVTAGYFAFFYVIAFVALHHFAPAMFLPLAAFWRAELSAGTETADGAAPLSRPGPSPLAVFAALGAVLAIVVAAPTDWRPYRATRAIAEGLHYDAGDYAGDYGAMRAAFDRKEILDSLFSPYWAVRDAGVERVGAPWMFVHYAAQARVPHEGARYLVQPVHRLAPAGMSQVATVGDAALFVRDTAAWRHERTTPPAPAPRARLYDVPRTTLFPHIGSAAGNYAVDLRRVADAVLKR